MKQLIFYAFLQLKREQFWIIQPQSNRAKQFDDISMISSVGKSFRH